MPAKRMATYGILRKTCTILPEKVGILFTVTSVYALQRSEAAARGGTGRGDRRPARSAASGQVANMLLANGYLLRALHAGKEFIRAEQVGTEGLVGHALLEAG